MSAPGPAVAARPADSLRARRVKLIVFALLLLGAAAGALLGLRLLGKLYPRVTVVQEQASALNLARRPEPVPPLHWQPGPADAALDGVSREDVRLAYLLAHAELTYARRSGDLTGLPGLFTDSALRQARLGARGLLLDWNHHAQVRRVTVSGPAPADGDSVELRDDSWAATARPAGKTWTDIVVARRTLDVTLRRWDGRWRISALRPVRQVQPTPGPVRTLTPGVASWRALTLPKTWATWTPDTWDMWLDRARRRHLGPLWAPLSSPPTRAELLALGMGLDRARRAGVGVVPAFTTPLTLEAVPLRAQVIAQLPPGTLAFDPGPLDPSDPGTVAALNALRLGAPRVALVATLRGHTPEPSAGARAGLSGTVTTSPAVATDHPETLLALPARGLLPPLPWKRRALDAALAAAGERGGWRIPLTDVLGPDGQPTARGTRLIRVPAAP
ncbi:hypothetical protein HNQ07_002404 [Deinococcus metalli]|uniref:Uncharacterized protein n=1 Tax=Deinococcus metalli TaxID=1141878 RepID=A0A7W8NQM0_9DEIO|nr:hypothetical protein [Deinococcus metalli]MBB5376940.1 hypothetical protein [Deinococcus metalli]GHF46456.1 hypothetical protein GCM10017781_23670 [Deinococcus metalli]